MAAASPSSALKFLYAMPGRPPHQLVHMAPVQPMEKPWIPSSGPLTGSLLCLSTRPGSSCHRPVPKCKETHKHLSQKPTCDFFLSSCLSEDFGPSTEALPLVSRGFFLHNSESPDPGSCSSPCPTRSHRHLRLP